MFRFAGALLLLIVLNVAFVYLGGYTWLQRTLSPAQPTVEASPAVIDVFTYTLQEEVDKKIGKPSQGYTPEMFLRVFPGLAETDFDGVEASSGSYTFVNGTLTFVLGPQQLMHNAAGAVSSSGMKTLLAHVTARTHINLETDGTITDVINALVVR